MQEVIKLEDNQDYLIIKKIKSENTTYVFLTNIKNVNDFCIRKTDESEENLIGLDSEEEFNKAMELFNTNL